VPPANLLPPPPTPPAREEELPELEALIRSGAIPHAPKGGVENKQGKANILIQVRGSRGRSPGMHSIPCVALQLSSASCVT
jgi:hypothetical protein